MINRFIYSMRYKYWNALFHSDEFMKLFTSKLRQDFMSKLSEMKYYDFNLFNVLQMRIELSRHLLSALEDNILQCFEEFSTKHSWYSECANNIHYYNGWAHNKAHYVTKRLSYRFRRGMIFLRDFLITEWKKSSKISKGSLSILTAATALIITIFLRYSKWLKTWEKVEILS